ncbi:MAG: F0F1 ATP synthase subunit alpha, partial [Rhodopila sp.]
SAEKGGGSLTALPIAETDAGNLSAYIPTNLISITDGQLVMSARLFQEGQKPAIDIGTSVSRVGGKTQAPALRAATGTMRLDYAQFLELEMFSRFGGVPDARVKAQLAHGVTLRTLLSQPQYRPLRLCDEVALAMALRDGLLDGMPPGRLNDFRNTLPAWLDQHADTVAQRLDRSGGLSPEDSAILAAAVRSLTQRYADNAA